MVGFNFIVVDFNGVDCLLSLKENQLLKAFTVGITDVFLRLDMFMLIIVFLEFLEF